LTYDEYIARPREQRRRRQSKAERAALRKPVGAAAQSPLMRRILRGLNGDAAGGAVSAALARPMTRPTDANLPLVRRVLDEFVEAFPGPARRVDVLVAVARLAPFRHAWRHELTSWKPVDAVGELAWSLACHLLCRRAEFPPPRWMFAAWVGDDALSVASRPWFVHVADGHNLCHAPDLPYPLSKRMAHHAMLAPAYLTPGQALRFGQARGTSESITPRAAEAIARTRLGLPQRDESYWKKFIIWYGHTSARCMAHADAIVDFVHACRFGEFGQPPVPGFRYTRYAPLELVEAANHWRARQQALRQIQRRWRSCGVAGYEDVEGGLFGTLVFRVVELRSATELRQEGDLMNHCAYTYAERAAAGECAIFSVRAQQARAWTPEATIEVIPSERMILQARARDNARVSDVVEQVIRRWATAVGLTFDSEALDWT
jgi:hypothetical protein